MKIRFIAITVASLVPIFAVCTVGSAVSAPRSPAQPPAISNPAIKIVGVGDSLTAGEQSAGLVGIGIPNPTQTHGYWALLWHQANGGDVSDPATSPLPLMKAPGMLAYLTLNAGVPTPIQNACAGYNATAYSFETALQARANPTYSPYDVAIPGQTVHEALYASAPSASGPSAVAPNGSIACNGAVPPTSFQAAVIDNGENTTFYPILATFGPNVTQVQAAVSLHGQIDTLWLGQNDQLKHILNPDLIPAVDPVQFGSDITTAIKALQGSGAKVAVANLMDPFHVAAWIPQPKIAAALVQFTSRMATPVDAATAAKVARRIDTILLTYGVGPHGYVSIFVLPVIAAHLSAPPKLSVGDYVPDTLAAQAESLDIAYNRQIAAAAASTGAALVDVHTMEAQAYATGGIPITSTCCFVTYGGGFYGLDGVHPSNTFYAILANSFIGTIDRAFGKSIPSFSPSDLAAIASSDPFAPK
jgi:hypothetical protein